MSLSSPAPFGDCEPIPQSEDANAFLERNLREMRIERGGDLAAMAREILGVLAIEDGLRRGDLWEAVAESLEIRQLRRGPISCAIDELAKRGVLIEADDRYSLNPAVAALIGRVDS